MASGRSSSSPQSDEHGSARRRQVEDIVTAVLRLPEAQRATYLNGACAADSALRREVDSMVALDGQAQHFLETPALETEAMALAGADDTMAGEVISHYRILGKIGAGGMG